MNFQCINMLWSEFLSDFRKQCLDRRVPIISLPTQEYLQQLIAKHKPVRVLEIGTAVGYSACMISREITSHHGIVYTFEIWYRDYLSAGYNFHRAHAYNVVSYHADFLSVDLVKLGLEKIDMILVDGRKNQYKEYILKVSDFVAPDGIIVIDDAIKFAHKTTSLYDFLTENQIDYELHQLDEDDGIIVIRDAGKQLAWKKKA